MLPACYQPLLTAINEATPCGVSLEYDPAFILLLSKLQPKLSAEYGNFVEVTEPVSWGEIERECLALLQKSRDIRLIIILMRCRLRQSGIPALAEGLAALHTLLETFHDDLHPQLMDEGEFEPLMRANAFSELDAIDGLLADLRNQPLPAAAGLHLTIKEYEKAQAYPREEGTLSQASLDALRHEWEVTSDDTMTSLSQSALLLEQIKRLLQQSLGADAPGLDRISHLLSLFSSPAVPATQTRTEITASSVAAENSSPPVSDEPDTTTVSEKTSLSAEPAVAPLKPKCIETRQQALAQLVEIRAWFENKEPSSPVPLLLAFAEKTVGMRFPALINILPAEIIALMSTDKD